MMAPRYTSDIDAARLTVVRSLENIQKALPENRRRSTQSISAALAFELGGNNSDSSTVVTPISRRGQIVAKDDDDAWKKHLRPSEIMALEDQLEVLQQDIRDLNNIHARHVQSSRQQWRYAQAEKEQTNSQRHRLRRVGEAAVLPQVTCRQSTSPPSSSSSDVRIPTADKDPRLLYPSSSSSNGKTQKQQQRNQSAMDRQPLMQRPVRSRDIRPVNTESNLNSRSHLSKATTAPRYQITTPEVISPTSSASVSSSLVEEVQHYNQYNARTANRRSMAGESSVGSESSHGNRRSSMSTGARRRSIRERKVRFVEESIQGFQEQTKTVARERDNSRVQNSLSRSSSSSSLSSCSSISRDVTSSWGENNPGLFDTHSLSADDEESASRASTSSRNQTDDTLAEGQSTMEPQAHIPVEVKKAKMTESTRGLIVRFFSRKSRGKGSTSSRGSTSSSGQSTSSKWDSTSSRSSVSEQINPSVSAPIAAMNGVKSSAFSSLPNPARSNPNNTSRPRENSAPSTPIRSLLRKHSVSLLNKFTGKDGKATVTPLGAVSEGALAQIGPTCAVCLEEFDRNSVIQVPTGCLHSYCKGCLKILFTRALDDPHGSFPVKCCGTTTIDVSVAGALLDANKIARYNELMLEYETVDKTYCYNKRCSTFIPPANIQLNGAKCRKCRRVTCTHCKKGKHRGVCIEDRDSMEVLEAGKNIGWVQCHRCQHLVEKSYGCEHITCQCKAEFCYKCGKEWKICLKARTCRTGMLVQ